MPYKVVIQWDPHHTPSGEKLQSGQRAIQIGIKGGEFSQAFHKGMIKIKDISEWVKQQNENRLAGKDFMVPIEEELELDKEVKERVLIGVRDE